MSTLIPTVGLSPWTLPTYDNTAGLGLACRGEDCVDGFFDAFEVGLLPTEPLGGGGKKTNKCERLSFFSFCRIS